MRVGLSVANFRGPGGPAGCGSEIAAAVLERWGAELVPVLRARPVAGRSHA